MPTLTGIASARVSKPGKPEAQAPDETAATGAHSTPAPTSMAQPATASAPSVILDAATVQLNISAAEVRRAHRHLARTSRRRVESAA